MKTKKKPYRPVTLETFLRKWRKITGETIKGRKGVLELDWEVGYSPEQSAKQFLALPKKRRY